MSKATVTYFFQILLMLTLYGCRQVSVPKPKAFLSLDYPIAKYQRVKSTLPLVFDKNEISTLELVKNNISAQGLNLKYNPLNAAVFISYKRVENNLENLIKSARLITQQHAKIAYSVSENEFRNDNNKVYGKIYDLSGPVASQIQFYVTDNESHFISGALYFNVKPNYDSIYPATRYIQKDIVHLMESLEWKK